MTQTHGFIRFDSGPGTLLAGVRRHHRMSHAQVSVPEQWTEFRELGLNGGRVIGAYCSMTQDGFEYMAGREVQRFDKLPPEIGRMRVPAQKYAVFKHEGNVREIGLTWQSIWRDWLPESGYEDAETPPLEVFGRSFNPDTGEGGLEIWFPVHERGAGS